MDLATQFKGFNNGNLCLAWSLMEKRGWKSRDTLNKARRELLDADLILVTRFGDRKRPNLYALTFSAIDECGGKLDVEPTTRPPSTWKRHDAPPPLKIVKSTPPAGVPKAGDMTRQACEPNAAKTVYDTSCVSQERVAAKV